MPKIFEIFGHALNDNSPEAISDRAAAHCPFMNSACDGGGNRHQSNIRLKDFPELKKLYPNREGLPTGVCSLQPKEDKEPWIVCPHRLLTLGNQAAGMRTHQNFTEKAVIDLFNYRSGAKIGVWKEVKFKYSPAKMEKPDDVDEEIEEIINETEEETEDLSVDYRFDYVVMPVYRAKGTELENLFDLDRKKLTRLLSKSGYEITTDGDDYYIEDFPYGTPNIIEIMTSSTSGGNKDKRTQIAQAFEDALLEKPHRAPGINYRQVWGRMVSQLISKSEIATVWGGATIWVVQDVLAKYISQTTALDLKKFKAAKSDEVNILSFSYGDLPAASAGIIDLTNSQLFAGKVKNNINEPQTFMDIIRLSVKPPVEVLIAILAKKGPAVNYIDV